MEMFYKYKHLSKAFYLVSKLNTKLVYPPISNSYSEETIYKAFITYCRISQDISLDEDLLKICGWNPETNNLLKNQSFEDKMKLLKSEGKNYNQEDLLFLIKVIQQRNIVDLELYKPIVNKHQQLNDYIDYLSSKQLEPKFDEFIILLQDLNNASVQEFKDKQDNLRNFLLTINNSLKSKLMEFLNEYKQNENTSKSFDFLKNIKDWIKLENETTINGKELASFKLREFLEQVIKDVNVVYPTIILNKKRPFARVPPHLNLSDIHINDIEEIIKKEIPLEKFFDKENILSRLMLM